MLSLPYGQAPGVYTGAGRPEKMETPGATPGPAENKPQMPGLAPPNGLALYEVVYPPAWARG
jgi:hypothetical protein